MSYVGFLLSKHAEEREWERKFRKEGQMDSLLLKNAEAAHHY
jgi:hypothetical protein